MKVAILGSRGVPAKYGAFEQCAEKLGLGLARMGCEVRVFCPHYQEYQGKMYEGLALEYIYHPPRGLGSLIYDFLSLLRASLQDNDIVLMLGYASSPVCFIPRLFGKKVVINTDGLEWRRSKWRWYARMYLRVAERCATLVANQLVSDAIVIQEYYLERYRVKSTFIPYGTEILPYLDSAALAEWGLTPGMYYIVVMRLEPENSIREIVRGFLSSKTERRLVIVGPSTDYFEQQVRPLLNGSHRVSYLGALYGRQKMFALRQHAFAYIHGHTVGGTNPSLLEAIASGNYVIARDVAFNREVVQEDGSYFSTWDELSKAIEECETSREEVLSRKRHGAKARVVRDYNWDRVVENYHFLFRQMLGKTDN